MPTAHFAVNMAAYPLYLLCELWLLFARWPVEQANWLGDT